MLKYRKRRDRTQKTGVGVCARGLKKDENGSECDKKSYEPYGGNRNMQDKIYTVAIIGTGARGADTYGRLIEKFPDRFKIVSLCDLKEDRLARYGKEFNVPECERFTDEDVFFQKKRADLVVIATPDNCHVRHAIKAFKVGYDMLLEKPITDKREECLEVLKAQEESGGKAMVCHVLRYAPAFVKMKELVDQGKIGKLVAINSTEQVAYWHQAHSYVRGNWRNREVSTPMILAKCCHDLDLLQYYAGSPCKSISSVGDLTYFHEGNAPEGSALRCNDCKLVNTCPYSAKRVYIERWEQAGKPEDCWPWNVPVVAPTTYEKLEEAIANGPYGRCVFHCDNNVVDHQITQMTFENGVKATLTMMGFTDGIGRRTVFHGTEGELFLFDEENIIRYKKFGGETEEYDVKSLADNGYGHGGGDLCLIEELYDMLSGNAKTTTSLKASVESHLMGIAAEESRLAGGKLILVHE